MQAWNRKPSRVCWKLNKSSSATLGRWERLMRTVEGPYTDAVVKEKNRFIEAVAADFKSQKAITQTQIDEHVAMMRRLADLYARTAIRLGLVEMLAKGVGKKATREWWDSLWLYLVRRWAAEYGAGMALETAMTTRSDIQRVIDFALSDSQEFNPVQVIQAILTVRDISRRRAEVIARTETHNAMMFAADEGARKLATDQGLEVMKRWIPVLDERTRTNHASMINHPAIPMDADFTVGGVKMSRPGDPRGGASNNIQCRCVLAYEAKE
jgi:hypothetical protein